MIVVTDPRVDHQAIREASYVNIPVIALCDTDAPMKYVDIAIPTNNKSRHSIGLMWWLLCREVLRLKGSVPRTPDGWSVMVDMFFYRDPEEIDKEQEDARLAKENAALAGTEALGQADWNVAGGEGAGTTLPGQTGGTLIEAMVRSVQFCLISKLQGWNGLRRAKPHRLIGQNRRLTLLGALRSNRAGNTVFRLSYALFTFRVQCTSFLHCTTSSTGIVGSVLKCCGVNSILRLPNVS